MSDATAAINDGTMIEKFDPSKLMDGVKDRIKSTFVSLIPDDAWEKMVEKEIYVFTTGRIELKSKCNYDKKDENGYERIKKTLEDMIVKNSGAIFMNIISGMMQRGIEQMKCQIQSQTGGY